jgi:hypothetical protein
MHLEGSTCPGTPHVFAGTSTQLLAVTISHMQLLLLLLLLLLLSQATSPPP